MYGNRPREQGFRVFCKLRQRREQAQSLICNRAIRDGELCCIQKLKNFPI